MLSEDRHPPGTQENWTKITFFPDLEKFGMTELDDDIIALMTRRVYDIAGACVLLRDRLPYAPFKMCGHSKIACAFERLPFCQLIAGSQVLPVG